MSSKPDTGAASVLAGGVIECSGRDAGAFLQAQLMNDVRQLEDGDWQWSGWLTPKGRIVALAALLRLEAERYWLVLPDHAAPSLAGQLQRYVMRSKLQLRVRDDLMLGGSMRSPASNGSVAVGRRLDIGERLVRMDWGGNEQPRTLTVGNAPDLPPGSNDGDATRWKLEDLAHGLPRLGGDASWTPQMLGLDRLHAYSVRKGCYPGQEIVARTHFLGQAKRGLVRLRVDQALGDGVAVDGPQGRVGEVVCAASDGARHEALALIQLDAIAAPLRVGDGPGGVVHVTGFAEGLAR
jgi:folate-binding protein YgfZ